MQYKDYKVVYENNRGTKITLTELPYAINIEPLLDYSWAYATRDRRRGSRVAGFNKSVASASLDIFVMCSSVEERNAAIDEFNNVIETDIFDGKPGKIWFNDWFTYGYIVSSANSKWQYETGFIKKQISFVREEETWFHVITTRSYNNIDVEQSWEDGIKDYEFNEDTGLTGYDYDYDYGVDSYSYTNITNPNPLGCNFVVIISGAATNPSIRIGQTIINVNVDIPDGAYLKVDSTEKTITLHYPDGTTLNAFGARNPDYYIFNLIEPGNNAIVWSGSYNWELEMIEERSEPRWLTEQI